MAYRCSSTKRTRSGSPAHGPNTRRCLASSRPSSSQILVEENSLEKKSFGDVTTLSSTLGEFEKLDRSSRENQFRIMHEGLLKLEAMSRSCPRLDMQLFQLHSSDTRISELEQEGTDSQLLDLERIWSSVEHEDDPKPLPTRSYREHSWYDDDLYWNVENSRFEVCRRCRHSLSDFEGYWRHRSLHGLFSHISSQLLQYRLTIYMKKSPARKTDGYKSCWEAIFLHSDRRSTLRLWDSKGAARIEFRGHRGSGDDALGFVNFLVALKFPHTYDGVIAGTVA